MRSHLRGPPEPLLTENFGCESCSRQVHQRRHIRAKTSDEPLRPYALCITGCFTQVYQIRDLGGALELSVTLEFPEYKQFAGVKPDMAHGRIPGDLICRKFGYPRVDGRLTKTTPEKLTAPEQAWSLQSMCETYIESDKAFLEDKYVEHCSIHRICVLRYLGKPRQ